MQTEREYPKHPVTIKEVESAIKKEKKTPQIKHQNQMILQQGSIKYARFIYSYNSNLI